MPADYPAARLVSAHPTNYRIAQRAGYTHVVLHITDGHGEAQGVAEMWQQPRHGSSAHFVIGQDGDVIQAVPLCDVAWHAHEVNSTSVGIEHCARSPKEWGPADKGLPVSDEQYRASAKLVAWLCHRAGLPADRTTILGHAEADPATTHSDCPTGALSWDRFMAALAVEVAALQAVA